MSLLELLNIGTTSSASVEESGFALPADSVLLWDRASELVSIPTGFSIYADADERLIQGTTTLVDAGTTGGSTGDTISTPTVGAVSSGGHGPGTTTFNFRYNNPFPGTASEQRYDAFSGVHSHTSNATPVSVPSSIRPMGRYMTLITNSSEINKIPSNCVIFSSITQTSFTRKTFDTHSVGLYTGTTTYARAKAADTFPFTIAWPSNGTHTHDVGPISPRLDGPWTPSTALTYPIVSEGSHTHPASARTLTAFQQFKHLLPFMASVNKPVQSGMIVMFKGVSVPSGWKICDGTNGTPNMNGFFLGYDNNENVHDIVKSNKRVDVTTNGYPLPTTAPPSPTNYQVLTDFSAATVTWPHTHRGTPSRSTDRYQQAVFHHTVSVPHSHPYPSASIIFPIGFTPNFIKLVFIQKE